MAVIQEINGVKCWVNPQGLALPPKMVSPGDKKRDKFVEKTVAAWKKEQERLRAFKTELFKEMAAYVQEMFDRHGVQHGGEKGNITLRNFSGNLKIELQVANLINFNEELMAAKAIIDGCIHDWSEGANANLSALVLQAFKVDGQGKISVGSVLGLRRINIKDQRWEQAMGIISKSVVIESTKKYIRVYERQGVDGQWSPVPLDFAAL